MSETSSETIGRVNPAAVVSSLIGQPRGGTGAVALSRPDAAKRLASQRVAVTDSNLAASLRQRCNAMPKLRSRVMAGEPDRSMLPAVPGPMDLHSALSMVELAFQTSHDHPAGDRLLDEALAYCDGLTVRKADDAAEVTVAAYKSALSRYPLDVALQALKEWPERHRFFPSWAELRELCERLVAPRRDLKAAIEWTIANGPDKSPEPMQRAPRETASPVANIRPQPAPPVRTREEQLVALNAMQGA